MVDKFTRVVAGSGLNEMGRRNRILRRPLSGWGPLHGESDGNYWSPSFWLRSDGVLGRFDEHQKFRPCDLQSIGEHMPSITSALASLAGRIVGNKRS